MINKSHTLVLKKTHEGTEVWECESCDRVVLIEWQPKWKRTVSVRGDPVAHAGFKGTEDVVRRIGIE